MLMRENVVLEVEHVSKLYARKLNLTRNRLANEFFQAFLGRPPAVPGVLKDGEFWGLKDISFSLERSEALGIIGLNGAGKTTLLRLLAGQILPDAGEIRIMGTSASMIDLSAGFQVTATGRQNIYLRSAMLGRTAEETAASYDEIIAFAELGDAINTPISAYSSGMLMRLAFSILVTMEPDILLIDEILAVGDFQFRQKCLARIREIRERSAFVLVTHSMDDIKLFCNRVIVLNKGYVAFEGEPEDAINFYQEMKFSGATGKADKQQEILQPWLHNESAVEDLECFWCDEEGNPITNILSGETLYFYVAYKLNHQPRNLIMGIPVWTEDGKYVTGFSTELSDEVLRVEVGQKTEFIIEVPQLAFNPGEYISNFVINDGLECLYRSAIRTLTVRPCRNSYWGVVTLPHQWRRHKGS